MSITMPHFVTTVTQFFYYIHCKGTNASVFAFDNIDEHKENVNQIDMYGNTPLFYSIKYNKKVTLFKNVLHKGGNMYLYNMFGYTTLMYMFLLDRYEYIIALLHETMYFNIDLLYQTIQPYNDNTFALYLLLFHASQVPDYLHFDCLICRETDMLFFICPKQYNSKYKRIIFNDTYINSYISNVYAFMLCFKYCSFRTIQLIIYKMDINDKHKIDSNGNNLFNYLSDNTLITKKEYKIIYNYFNPISQPVNNTLTNITNDINCNSDNSININHLNDKNDISYDSNDNIYNT